MWRLRQQLPRSLRSKWFNPYYRQEDRAGPGVYPLVLTPAIGVNLTVFFSFLKDRGQVIRYDHTELLGIQELRAPAGGGREWQNLESARRLRRPGPRVSTTGKTAAGPAGQSAARCAEAGSRVPMRQRLATVSTASFISGCSAKRNHGSRPRQRSSNGSIRTNPHCEGAPCKRSSHHH